MGEVKWLVEHYQKDKSIDLLIDEVKLQGMQCEVIKEHFWEIGECNQYKDEECVVFYGSLNLARKLQKTKGWIPGPYCNFKNFQCSTYYSYWGQYLLNDDYIMLPLMDFYRRRESVYRWYGLYDNCIFMRSNSGAKSFNGAIFPKEELDSEMQLINTGGGKPSDEIIVIISTPKVIEKEWRIVIANRRAISYSQYKKDGKVDIIEGCDSGAIELANLVAKEEWQPDYVYTLDICKSNDDYYLLECNSFSCAGLYDCSVKRIVKSVSEVALKEWREYQEV